MAKNGSMSKGMDNPAFASKAKSRAPKGKPGKAGIKNVDGKSKMPPAFMKKGKK